MKLTGKCKEDFEKWLICGNGRKYFEGYYDDSLGSDDPYEWFNDKEDAEKYGVLVDYFDSIGIIIDMQSILEYNEISYTKVKYWRPIVIELGVEYDYKDFDEYLEKPTRPEARTAAVEKANEIYNVSK